MILKWIKNQPIKKPQIDDEFKQIKEANQLDEKIDINKIIISDEEKYLVKDYLYYIGFWNKNEIIDNWNWKWRFNIAFK